MTLEDTTKFLVEQAIRMRPNEARMHAKQTWDDLSRQYTAEREQITTKYLNMFVHTSKRLETLRSFLLEFAQVDMSSIRRVIQCKILAGLTDESIKLAAKASCAKFYEHVDSAFKRSNQAHIISSNWSRRMIELSLQQRGVARHTVSIHGNGTSFVCRMQSMMMMSRVEL